MERAVAEASRQPALRLAVALVAALAVAGCKEQGGPYLATRGGGFLFNYRIAEASAGIVVGPAQGRTLPEGSTIEVTFENPAGGPPIVISKAVSTPPRDSYTFQTPALTGIRADRDYAVTVRLIGANGAEIEKIDKAFRSEIDQTVLPEVAPVIGPGYTANPAAAP